MSERKNIDKLFQEKFKDFEMDPPEHTWPELEARLKKKKDRKIIPFWWRLSGVAAALLIGFLIADGIGLFGDKNASEQGVAVEEKNDPKVSNPTMDSNAIRPNEAVVENTSDSVQTESAVAETPVSENQQLQSATQNENNPGAKKTEKFDAYKAHPKNAVANSDDRRNQNTTPASQENNRVSDKIRNPKNRNQKTNSINQQTAVAENRNKKSDSQRPQDSQQPDQTPANQHQTAVAQKQLPLKTDKATERETQTGIANQNKNDLKSSEAATINQKTQLSLNTTDNNQVAAAEEKNQKKLDSTATAMTVPNALEELLHEKENKVTKEPKLNRWQLTSNVAPIYFGSTSGGSPIDSTFASKSKDYNTQVSYGIGVNYAVSKKITIRAGVNKVSLDYDTNDVQLYASLHEGGFQNLDQPAENNFLNFGRVISAVRTQGNVGARSESTVAAVGDIQTDKFVGTINQKMGYIEVPVEVSYAVIDKKFGVNVIAGVSTLFLNENEVTLTSEGLKTDLGEANNLNSTHFSTNVGLGVKYTFLKSFEAKFEPMFKYQLNTFSKNNGDFKPYFFGLYTGLSFRF